MSGLARLFPTLGRIAPDFTAAIAEWLFFRPLRTRPTALALVRLSKAKRDHVKTGGGRVSVWHWGRGPAVYLVHGWSGNAGQMSAFAQPLVEAGFRVVAFDAPGHGASSGQLSSAPQFADALRALVKRYGPPVGIVAHSLGAAGSALALADGLCAERVVFIGPAARPTKWADRFSDSLRLSPGMRARLRRRSEQRLDISWDRLDVANLGRNLAVPLLVVHDRQDREVPWEDGHAIAGSWPGALLQTTEGLGHRRLLEDETVVREIVTFVGGGTRPLCQGCGKARIADPYGVLCDSCEIEQMLFRPEDRPSRNVVFQH